jgi:hypothetical protein
LNLRFSGGCVADRYKSQGAERDRLYAGAALAGVSCSPALPARSTAS